MASRERQAQIAKMLGLYDPKGGEICPTCGSMIDKDSFRDDLSREEYRISGMCQNCQDETFTDDGFSSNHYETEQDAVIPIEEATCPVDEEICCAPNGDCTTCLSLRDEEE